MRIAVAAGYIFVLWLPFISAGCGPASISGQRLSAAGDGSGASVYIDYAPVKVDILPLTGFVALGEAGSGKKIRAYVSLLDKFGCQVKTPAVFRFELYEYVQRSAEPKGKRVFIWPDIDLTDVTWNHGYWRDFLRAYEFDLDFDITDGQSFMLQVTCLCPNGRRLSAEFCLRGP